MIRKKDIYILWNKCLESIKMEYNKDNDCYYLDIDNLVGKCDTFTPNHTYIGKKSVKIIGTNYYFNGVMFKTVNAKMKYYLVYQRKENIVNSDINISYVINIEPNYINSADGFSIHIDMETFNMSNIMTTDTITDRNYIRKNNNRYYCSGIYIELNKSRIRLFFGQKQFY